jgi:hypothetical protein
MEARLSMSVMATYLVEVIAVFPACDHGPGRGEGLQIN